MKLVFWILLCLSPFFISDKSSEPSIKWSGAQKLQWDDFKGKPNNNTKAVALTASGIVFEYALKTSDDNIIGFEPKVNAFFYPEKSWVKLADTTSVILNHEQLHFDITELHARRFRMELGAVKISRQLVQDIDRLHLQINRDWAKMQENYDRETNFSRDLANQLKWQAYISTQLKQLESYK
ncbi:hypothetical protein GZ212_10000 [Mangrovimonas sp. CR14]|uniref:DUF922 domain-containing protein n=1 Tax=Mangrovimonas sp. CR14 TaxID=2706120 RepID=UPI0014243D52|nr:DUF922 domain-containing protein [Mangrovimonas sp. CR14]NIK92479.1 hypothetical protein [Mangrovimonas sp. CR14]